MADSSLTSRSKIRRLGHQLWGMIDVGSLKPCREPVALNPGTSFVLDWAMQALSLVPRNQRPEGYLGIGGESRFRGTQFPEGMLSILAGQVDLAIRGLVELRSSAPFVVSGDQFRIELIVLPQRSQVQEWLESRFRSTNQLKKDLALQSQFGQTPLLQPAGKARDGGKLKAGRRSWESAIQALVQLGRSAANYDAVYAGVLDLRHQMQSGLATALQDVFNARLGEMPKTDYRQKQALASWVNSQLRELGFAIQCPKTGRPAILIADLRDAEDQQGRFRLEIRTVEGRRIRTMSATELPSLTLIEDEPRAEGLSKKSSGRGR